MQVSSQSPALRDDDFKDVIVAVLSKGIEAAKQLLEKANSIVDYVENNPEEVEAKIVADAVAQGKKLNEKLVEILKKLEDDASADGAAVLKCIAAEQDKIDAAFEKTATDIGSCAAGEANIVAAGVKDVLNQLSQLVSDIESPLNDLESCSQGDTVCLVLFISAEVEVAKKVPEILKEDLDKLQKLAEQVHSDVAECSASILKEAEESSKAIFNEAVACIKG